MSTYRRVAVYYTPPPGELTNFGASWLGWDVAQGVELPHPAIAGLPKDADTLTSVPRKYGFHATLKAPFRLAEGIAPDDLLHAAARLAGTLAPVGLAGGLRLSRLGDFVALVPAAPGPALQELAAALVRELDPLRAPLNAAEIARRRPESLSPAQRDNLDRWGYPHVLDAFRFHMTLTGPLTPEDGDAVVAALDPVLAPLLPDPHPIDAISIVGEAGDGRFRLIERLALTGGA